MWSRHKTVNYCTTVAVAISTDDGETRWHKLAELAQKEESLEKRFVILEELCSEYAALQKQLISAKTQTRKRHRETARKDVTGSTTETCGGTS